MALLLSSALVPFTSVKAQASNPQPAGITVNGSGVAYGEPDQAVVTLGVDATADNVRQAMDQADATMTAVRQAILNLGIDQQDIRTVSFNIWRQDLTDKDGQPTGQRYHVQHSFQTTLRDGSQVGQLLADAVDAGANDVGGINFTISNTAQLQTQARQAAMADAQERAQQLAQLAGVSLGAPTYIEETSYNAPMPMADAQYSRMASAPIQGGQLGVNVTVRVTYAIGAAN
jgi:uncharacterized protein YggE